MDAAEIDLGDAFEPGMGYVALSRVRRLSGLKLMNLNEMALTVDTKILQQDQVFKDQSAALVRILRVLSEKEIAACQRDILIERFGGRVPHMTYQKNLHARKAESVPTQAATLELLKQGLSIEVIAKKRRVSVRTIITHIEKLKTLKQLDQAQIFHLKDGLLKKDFDRIFAAFKLSEGGRLKPVYDKFKGQYSYLHIQLVRLFFNEK